LPTLDKASVRHLSQPRMKKANETTAGHWLKNGDELSFVGELPTGRKRKIKRHPIRTSHTPAPDDLNAKTTTVFPKYKRKVSLE
jgi:hypothetical protein